MELVDYYSILQTSTDEIRRPTRLGTEPDIYPPRLIAKRINNLTFSSSLPPDQPTKVPF